MSWQVLILILYMYIIAYLICHDYVYYKGKVLEIDMKHLIDNNVIELHMLLERETSLLSWCLVIIAPEEHIYIYKGVV